MAFLFTADDAGASVEVNEAIRRACTEGHVNSVAFLVNLTDFEDARERIAPVVRERSVHLNLVEGRPLALDPSSPLVDRDGWFAHQSTGLLSTYYRASSSTRARIAADTRKEIAAQLTAFGTVFDGPIAVDSHQHVHMFPFVLPQVLAAADTIGATISRLRWPVERVPLRRCIGGGAVKASVLSAMARSGARLVPSSIPRTSAFCGVVDTGRMTADVARAFVTRVSGLPQDEVAELLIHPGGGDTVTEAWERSPSLRAFYTSPWRQRELALACDDDLLPPGLR